MRILILTSWFSRSFDDGTLVNDLASKLAEQGHDVLVYVQDWESRCNKRETYSDAGVTIVWQPHAGQGRKLGPLSLPVKWFMTSYYGWKNYKKTILDFKPEGILGFAPAVIYFWILRKLLGISKNNSVVIQWDFFPIHHQKIGMIKGRLFSDLIMRFEQYLLNKFDCIAHMSDFNVRYFDENYKKCQSVDKVILPIWGSSKESSEPVSRQETLQKYQLPDDKILIVFGGQLSAGRGLENILQLAAKSQDNNPDAYFVIIGSGKMKGRLSSQIEELNLENIRLMDRIPRDEYQTFLKVFDIGLVSTTGGTGVPTFPSKSIDYMRNKLPIVATTENTTDFGKVLEAANAGIYVPAGQNAELLEAVSDLCSNKDKREQMGLNAYKYFLEKHDVDKISQLLVSHLSN